jgi:predicted nucleic acid-binding protein
MRFVDTNILIYAVSLDEADADKNLRALELLRERELAFSVQVFQEFYVQATRETRPGALSHRDAVDFIVSLQRFRVQEITLKVMCSAFELRERYGLSYWDCAILASAKACGCRMVYSEDFSSEQDYEGLQVVNPFA